MSVKYDIPLQVQTKSSNCVQTSTSQFISFYGLDITPDDIEKDIPVRFDKDGKPMGTLLPDIGTWLIKNHDMKATMHVFDAQIIDRSWAEFNQDKLLDTMEKVQKTGISTAKTWYAPYLIESYIDFLKAGGLIDITKCTNKLLRSLLDKGTVLAIVSFNYLYDWPREVFNKKTGHYEEDAINGKVTEHAIVLTGYDEGIFYYNDPAEVVSGQKTVQDDVLIGAICTAQINSDNYLLTIEKPI
ncbi:MAG: C39 family peptidase [bacterium]